MCCVIYTLYIYIHILFSVYIYIYISYIIYHITYQKNMLSTIYEIMYIKYYVLMIISEILCIEC